MLVDLKSSDMYNTHVFSCFTIEQVKEINKEIKKNPFQKEPQIKVAKYASKVGEFFNVPCIPLMELLHPWLYKCQIINKDVFGYDIDWHFHLDMFNYNVYGINGEYGFHIDATGPRKIDLKLTCILNLSEEPYEGGNFFKINEEEEIKFDSGMALIFNSLIAHKVTPVTKGERITLTYWGEGPPWR